jgi:ABC-2 type transport system permease protein
MARNQITAVVWKEWHEIFRLDQGARPILFRLTIAGAFIVAFAWRKGADFGRDASSILLLMEFTILPTLPLPPDAFAGERERHTLETLLASSIHDWAIYFGKFFAILGIGVGFAVLACIIDVLVIAVRFSGWRLTDLSPAVLASGLALGALSAAIVVGFGILISMHSRTVRSANVLLGWTLVGLFLLGSNAFRSLAAQWAPSIARWRAMTSPGVQVLMVAGVLGVVAILLCGIGLKTFNRRRIIQLD